MNFDRRVKFAVLLAVLCLICDLVFALSICRKCGYELEEGAVKCGHCQAAVVKEAPKNKTEAVAVEDDGGDVIALAEEYVRQQYKLAQKYQDNPGLAFAYNQNAFAVLRLVPADERSLQVGKSIMQNLNLNRRAASLGKVSCHVCKGTGKYKVDLGKVDGSTNITYVDGIKCKYCKGLGYRIAHLSVERIKMNILKGRQQFEQQRAVAGDRRVGYAYLSEELSEKVDLRQRVLVMTGIRAPCKDCHYTGLEVCSSCRGKCWEKCPSELCDEGMINRSSSSSRSSMVKKRLNEALVERCGRCQGWGEVPCHKCQGKGCQICEECGGTGDAPLCKSCSGAGLVVCKKCNGTGKYKDAECSKCSGAGELLCTSCKGEGSISK